MPVRWVSHQKGWRMGSMSWHARLLAVLWLAAAASAQETRSAVQGQVSDPQGASVVHAVVVVTNTKTNVSNSVATNDTGHYEANFLIPGDYEVSAEAPG